MRCGCPTCGTLMIHEESGAHLCCVCPHCLSRCNACLGTNSALSKEEVERMKQGDQLPQVLEIADDFAQICEPEEQEALEALREVDNPDTHYLD